MMDVKNKTVHIQDNEDMNDWQPPIPAVKAMDKVYIPDWTNRPIDQLPVLSINGQSILTNQNISAIIAAPGLGKSSICEATCANHLNPNADCLSIEVSQECTGLIYIDFERTNLDVWHSYYRMCKRAGIIPGEDVEGVIVAGMRSIPRLEERLTAIEHLLDNNPCSLLLLDGAGDLVTDTNDLPQAIECRIFLRELTVKYNLSILTTLHPNPNSFKPRGHIGSEILRESECVLLAKKFEGENRIITSDFEFGKNRNNAVVTSGYTWSIEHSMFVTYEIENIGAVRDFKTDQKRSKAETLVQVVLPLSTSLSPTDLIKAICQYSSVSESTAKRTIKDLLAWDIIEKDKAGMYSINTNDGSRVQTGFKQGSDDPL